MNSILIEWRDGKSTTFKRVVHYNMISTPILITYEEENKQHELYIQHDAVDCILVSPYMEKLEE